MSYLNSAVPYRILNLAGKNSADPQIIKCFEQMIILFEDYKNSEDILVVLMRLMSVCAS